MATARSADAAVDPLAIAPVSVQTGDFNGDGKLDLLVWDDTVSFLAGDGDGTFQSPGRPKARAPRASPMISSATSTAMASSTCSYPWSMRTAPHSMPRRVSRSCWAMATAPSGPRAAVPTDTIGGAVPLGDFNGDGRIDLAAESVLLPASPSCWVTVKEDIGSDSGSRWNHSTSWERCSSGISTATAGRTWLRSSPDRGRMMARGWSCCSGMATGRFQAKTYPIPDGSASQVEVEGIYDDLPYQVTVGGFEFSVGVGSTTSHSSATAAPPVSGPVNPSLPGITFVSSPVILDFNGDGLLDVGVVGATGHLFELFIFMNNGKGGCSLSQTIADPSGGIPLVGDFNGDGKPDLAILNEDDDTASVSFDLGRGDGTFGPTLTEPVPLSLLGPYGALASFRIAMAHSTAAASSTCSSRMSRARRSSSWGSTATAPSRPRDWCRPRRPSTPCTIGDLNGDGRPDLILAGDSGGPITILIDNGDGTFSEADQVVTSPQDTPLVVDVNGDGTEDVLVVDGSGHILYRQGQPSQPGSFHPPVTINGGSPSRDIAWVPDTAGRPAAGQRRRPGRRRLALRLPRRRFIPRRLAGHGSAPGPDRRRRSRSRRLGRPGGPQCRRRDPVRLPEQRPGQRRQPASASRSSRRDDRRRPRCLRPPGDRYHGRRMARPGDHRRVDRPGERLAQPGRRRLRIARALSRGDRSPTDSTTSSGIGPDHQPGIDHRRRGRILDARRARSA